MIQYFKFEEDFVEENIRCIPMIARFKLDASGIKLKLKEWSTISEEERINFSEYPCSTIHDIDTYRRYVIKVILFRTGMVAQEMPIDQDPTWANRNKIPDSVLQKLDSLNATLTVSKWEQLTDLQRFVLVKLSRPSHENRNFPIALKEFELI